MSYIINPFAFGSAPHRYWQIDLTARQDGGALTGGIGCAECELYTTYGGQQLSHIATVTSSAAASGQVVARARDGLFGVSALGNFATNVSPAYMHFDFGAGNEQIINHVILTAFEVGFNAGMTRDFTIKSSDDNSVWTIEWTVSGETGWGNYERREFPRDGYTDPSYTGTPHGSHAYWRLVLLDSASSAYSMAELEMRATPGGADQCTGGTGSAAQSFSGSFDGPKAFDDNTTTLWSSTNKNGAQWIKYAFASPVSVAQLSITARNDVSYTQTPTLFFVEHSDDDSEWTPAWRQTATWSSAGQTQTFTDPRYV